MPGGVFSLANWLTPGRAVGAGRHRIPSLPHSAGRQPAARHRVGPAAWRCKL